MKIDFGEWLPDQPSLDNPGCTDAYNVIPLARSYGQYNNLSAYSDALTSSCLGAFTTVDRDNAPFQFAGDANALYLMSNTNLTWADVGTSNYSTATSWNFEKFGDRVIAVSVENDPEYYNVESGSAFVRLGGSPPRAKYIAAIRDFVVLANIQSNPNRVQWCGFNNAELWTPNLTTQSDFQDIPGRGGIVRGIVPGAYGVVFQDSSIWRMDYTGPPTIFRFDEVERGRGTSSPRSICYYGTNVFYYDPSGFYVFTGQGSTAIGHERMDAWFKDNLGEPESIQGVVDRKNQLVLWGFKSTAASPVMDRVVIYNFAANRWSWGALGAQFMFERVSSQYDQPLDDLDTPYPLGIDLQSIPMDEPAFKDDLEVMAFDGDNKAASFNGAARTARITTKEVKFDEAGMFTQSVRPLADLPNGGSVTVRVGKRDRRDAAVTYTNTLPLNRIGEASPRVNMRFQRYELQIEGGFDFTQGVEIRARRAGRRS